MSARAFPLLLLLLSAEGPALAAPADAEVARTAWEAARAGATEAAPLVAGCLEAAGRRPADERSWALEQVLLDALVSLEVPACSVALLPFLETHVDTVVLLLVRGGEDAVPGLRTAYDRLDPGRWNEAWWTAGAALAQFDADRFRRRLLPDVAIERAVVVSSSGLPRPAARDRPRREPSSARPPPTYETWEETHDVPDGFPPVGTWRLHHREGPGRTLVHPRVPAYAERTVEDVRPGDAARRVVLHRTTEDDRSPAQARLDWLQAPVLGEAGVVRLHAGEEIHHEYAGPTPWRRFIAPLQRALDEAWWATVVALVRTGRLSEEEARTQDTPIAWDVRDGRGCSRPPLLPLPAVAGNPYAVRKRSSPGGL